MQFKKIINREYAAVCSLLHRSGLPNDYDLRKTNLAIRNFHLSSVNLQQPNKNNSNDPKKPNNDDEDKDKISSLIAKAFLWMLTAYMVIAIISLMFPSSNQPEVIQIKVIKFKIFQLKVNR